MSLANEEDIIIPGTTGIMTCLSREANSEIGLVDYIRNTPVIYRIFTGRIQGVPLYKLVNPSRITSNSNRNGNGQEEKGGEQPSKIYEPWFRE